MANVGITDMARLPGNLAKLKQVQDKISAQKTVVEEDGVRVVVKGDQQLEEFSVQGVSNDLVVQKINKALRLSQESAAKLMQGEMGGLGGLANMLGGGK